VVAPASYAVPGTPFTGELWAYKTGLAAPDSLLALLLAFLHDHGRCVWSRAGMPGPDCLAVVPSGSGRPGEHPLLSVVEPCLRLPVVWLSQRPGTQSRHFDATRCQAGPIPGRNVLLLDDTWVSGASIQSAAAALKRAGAAHVAAVVIARLLSAGDPRAAALATRGYDPGTCALHAPG
jgi:hypothetical protein